MKIPTNPDFYAKLIVALVVVLGVIYLQATTGTVPEWLSTAFVAIITFILGLTTQAHSHDKQ